MSLATVFTRIKAKIKPAPRDDAKVMAFLLGELGRKPAEKPAPVPKPDFRTYRPGWGD